MYTATFDIYYVRQKCWDRLYFFFNFLLYTKDITASHPLAVPPPLGPPLYKAEPLYPEYFSRVNIVSGEVGTNPLETALRSFRLIKSCFFLLMTNFKLCPKDFCPAFLIISSFFFLADGASSIAASVRLEQALSDEATSTSVKLSVPAVLALQAKLWLAIGKLSFCESFKRRYQQQLTGK